MRLTCSSGKRSTSVSAAASTRAESLTFGVVARGLCPEAGAAATTGVSAGRRNAVRARACIALRRLR
eukprot:1990776-Lingulodinium_polyedra.AAC.1